MVIAYSSARHGRFHQKTEPSLSAAQPAHPCLPPPATPHSLHVLQPPSRNPSTQTAPGLLGTSREVLLKAIQKKQGKGNEESVWSEMGCPSVSTIQTLWVHPPPSSPWCASTWLCPNMFGHLSVGHIFRMVRLSDTILPRFRACCRRRVL